MSNIQYQLFTGLEARLIDPENLPWPGDSAVLYAIENNEVVGRMGIIELPHIEGTWIREDKRNSSIGFRLITKLENILEEENRSAIFAFAANNQPEISNYLERLGYSLMPVKIYMKPLIDTNKKEN